MVKTGEMTEDAMRECSRMPFMEYEVRGWLDMEGLEGAKDLLTSPKQRRIEAGVDPMLSSQGLNPEQRRRKNKRRIDRNAELKKGVRAGMDKMRAMAEEGYDSRQIALSLITPQMGKKVREKQTTLSPKEKAKQQMRRVLMRNKAQEKAKAQGKDKTKAEAQDSPEVA